MAIFDAEALFSNDQAITITDTTVASTNLIDLGAAVDIQPGEPLQLQAIVTTAFSAGTSLSITVQQDTVAAFSSPTSLVATAAIAQASLVAGYEFVIAAIPTTSEQFIRLLYTAVGAIDGGTVLAGINLDRQRGVNAV